MSSPLASSVAPLIQSLLLRLLALVTFAVVWPLWRAGGPLGSGAIFVQHHVMVASTDTASVLDGAVPHEMARSETAEAAARHADALPPVSDTALPELVTGIECVCSIAQGTSPLVGGREGLRRGASLLYLYDPYIFGLGASAKRVTGLMSPSLPLRDPQKFLKPGIISVLFLR